jgi:hypothetical protein
VRRDKRSDGVGDGGRVVDRDPCLGPFDRDKPGSREIGRESLRVSDGEEVARVTPYQQDGLVEAGDRLCGIHQELRSEAGEGSDEIRRNSGITLSWFEERFLARIVQSCRRD